MLTGGNPGIWGGGIDMKLGIGGCFMLGAPRLAGFIANIGGGFIPGGRFKGGNLEKSMVGGIIVELLGTPEGIDSGFGGVAITEVVGAIDETVGCTEGRLDTGAATGSEALLTLVGTDDRVSCDSWRSGAATEVGGMSGNPVSNWGLIMGGVGNGGIDGSWDKSGGG